MFLCLYIAGSVSYTHLDVYKRQHLGDVRVLNSIIDMDELKELVTKICEEKGLI